MMVIKGEMGFGARTVNPGDPWLPILVPTAKSNITINLNSTLVFS